MAGFLREFTCIFVFSWLLPHPLFSPISLSPLPGKQNTIFYECEGIIIKVCPWDKGWNGAGMKGAYDVGRNRAQSQIGYDKSIETVT